MSKKNFIDNQVDIILSQLNILQADIDSMQEAVRAKKKHDCDDYSIASTMDEHLYKIKQQHDTILREFNKLCEESGYRSEIT